MTTTHKSYVCDISNIASFNQRKGKPKLGYIDALFDTIADEYEIVAVADNSLYRRIDEKNRYKSEYLLPQKIIEAPANCAADIFILQYAWNNECSIISNDLFREYKQYPKVWIKAHRISFMILDNQIFFSDNNLTRKRRNNIGVMDSSNENKKIKIRVG